MDYLYDDYLPDSNSVEYNITMIDYDEYLYIMSNEDND